MHPEIEKLIDLALMNGEINERSKALIHRKGSELNLSFDDIESFINKKLDSIKKITMGEKIGLTIHTEVLDDNNDFTAVNIRVSESDFEPMSYLEATEACYSLGEGWRLPTKIELKAMLEEIKMLEMVQEPYWSSSLNKNNNIWVLDFENEEFELSTGNDYHLKSRAVISI